MPTRVPVGSTRSNPAGGLLPHPRRRPRQHASLLDPPGPTPLPSTSPAADAADIASIHPAINLTTQPKIDDVAEGAKETVQETKEAVLGESDDDEDKFKQWVGQGSFPSVYHPLNSGEWMESYEQWMKIY
ncbi:hypothetical protein TRIUR3_14176 [Triticum urartu]|uniref:Uncharacterized protein n=1 Tax=Triticum urartu TaxID=4572 RepID=M7YZ19_TRIUA|nr:hypothetical protein TRIUR3_14176 [Triticum urartu]